MAKTIKSISFNDKNEKDVQMMKHFARRNFSGYVKKLILEDIKKKEGGNVPQKKTHVKPITPPNDRKGLGRGITKQPEPKTPFFPGNLSK